MHYIVAIVVVLVPLATSAQTRDVGVVLVRQYQYFDVSPECCGTLAWVTLGSGQRFRLHVDYMLSDRFQKGLGGYPHDDVDGLEASTLRDSITQETFHDVNVLAAWRAYVEDGFEFRLLFGGGLRYSRRTDCTAFAGSEVRIPTPLEYGPRHVVFHAALTDEDYRRCAARRFSQGPFYYPQVAATADWSIGKWLFIRIDARLTIFRIGIGGGFRF